jgi:hypothetical protein
MKFDFKTNVAKLVVLAILLSAVACSELPELTKLMDNPSNDFTTSSHLMAEVSSVVAAPAKATAPASGIMPRQKPSKAPRHISRVGNPRDLLLLCSILRT